MRIESTNPFTPPPPAPAGDSGVRKASGSGVREAEAAVGFAPTGDLSRLLSLVQAQPDVRAAVVADVTARIAGGELATRQAAAETAASILDGEPAV